MSVDLHAHSTASDGTVTPAGLVDEALALGLSGLAITDHDTLEGIEEARRAASGSGLELIPGTELSLDYDRGGMHLVVLWLEPAKGPLQDRLASLQQGRDLRNAAILEQLDRLGMSLEMDEVLEEAGEGSVGRPHIAAVLMRKGFVPDIRTAFDLWLAAGRPAYVGRPRLAPEEAIGLARESGAVPILAHPHTLGIHRSAEMARLLGRLLDAGLIGLEAEYSLYRRHERDGYAHLARRFGLLPSGGSDYHGRYKPGLYLGTGYGDLRVPEEMAEALREHAGAR
jgi:predicted metal-dependent phosphoesterase TrpH